MFYLFRLSFAPFDTLLPLWMVPNRYVFEQVFTLVSKSPLNNPEQTPRRSIKWFWSECTHFLCKIYGTTSVEILKPIKLSWEGEAHRDTSTSSENCRTSYIYKGSPSGCVWREILGLTQVDEKGHEGNTAVVTAYFVLEETWSKKQQDRSSCWLPGSIIYFGHYIIPVQQSCWVLLFTLNIVILVE